MMRAALVALALLGGSAAAAHPHAQTTTQAVVTLAPKRITLRLVAVPGTDDGTALAARIDADGDGLVSDGEAEAVARAMLTGATLTVDGALVPLRLTRSEAGPANRLAAGEGHMRAEAEAAVDLSGVRTVMLRIDPAGLGTGWFVQPYYAEGLGEAVGTPALERVEDGVVLRFARP